MEDYLDFVDKTIILKYRMKYISEYMPFEFIEHNITQYDWNWAELSCRKDIPLEFMERHCKDTSKLSSYGISTNPSVTIDFIQRNIDWPWEWGYDGLSSTASMDIVRAFPDKPWEFGSVYGDENEYEYDGPYEKGLSSNPNLTLDFIEDNIDKNWNWGYYGLSTNPCITVDFVIKHYDKPWYKILFYDRFPLSILEEELKVWSIGSEFSKNPYLTLEFVKTYQLSYEWNFGKDGLSSNPAVTEEWVKQLSRYDWDWKTILTRFPALKKMYGDKLHDFSALSKDPRLSLKFLERTIHFPEWKHYPVSKQLTSNPAVPLGFILKHPYCRIWIRKEIVKKMARIKFRERAAWAHSGFLYDNLSLKVMELM